VLQVCDASSQEAVDEVAALRVPGRVAAVVVGLLTLVLPGCASTGAPSAATTPNRAPTSTTTSASVPGGSCRPLPLVSTTYIAADDSRLGPNATDADRRKAAIKKEYLLPDGRTMSTIIPPDGFDPETADPATARVFGFDEPKRYAGYRGTIESVPCASHVRHGTAR
jgi:hypothetical protein